MVGDGLEEVISGKVIVGSAAVGFAVVGVDVAFGVIVGSEVAVADGASV